LHVEQALAAESEKVPAGQSLQAVGLLAAASPENVPAPQLVHADAFCREYAPASHGVHPSSGFDESVPAAQTAHAAAAVESVVEPTLHRAHSELPLAEKVPSGQASQDHDPAKTETVPAPQGAQVDEPFAPTAGENVPALQLWHRVVPSADEKVPAPHARHSPALLEPCPVWYVPRAHGRQSEAHPEAWHSTEGRPKLPAGHQGMNRGWTSPSQSSTPPPLAVALLPSQSTPCRVSAAPSE
jgi:hypothetical protein